MFVYMPNVARVVAGHFKNDSRNIPSRVQNLSRGEITRWTLKPSLHDKCFGHGTRINLARVPKF